MTACVRMADAVPDGRAPDGMVTIRYKARVPRFRGGAITRGDGYVVHTFGMSDTFRRRWWSRRPTPVEYIVVGGAGGASTQHPGQPGGQGGKNGASEQGGDSAIDGTYL